MQPLLALDEVSGAAVRAPHGEMAIRDEEGGGGRTMGRCWSPVVGENSGVGDSRTFSYNERRGGGWTFRLSRGDLSSSPMCPEYKPPPGRYPAVDVRKGYIVPELLLLQRSGDVFNPAEMAPSTTGLSAWRLSCLVPSGRAACAIITRPSLPSQSSHSAPLHCGVHDRRVSSKDYYWNAALHHESIDSAPVVVFSSGRVINPISFSRAAAVADYGNWSSLPSCHDGL
ncbi:hypothetical protein EYF80_000278 [Liparis tanakae]|uniref:Uncharacterized protein n=1 Tax=Liparis tanakae TaxID=230148 RepID=A0A4Z2JHB8_9TELE|nr:hypothetical protein EYF80_000278 [Liparis tanakae]